MSFDLILFCLICPKSVFVQTGMIDDECFTFSLRGVWMKMVFNVKEYINLFTLPSQYLFIWHVSMTLRTSNEYHTSDKDTILLLTLRYPSSKCISVRTVCDKNFTGFVQVISFFILFYSFSSSFC